MPEHTNLGMGCSEFDLLLSDALDGVLTGAELNRFQAHASSCKACGPLFAEAEAGRTWLKGLTEVEPPAHMVASILASTTGVDTQRLRATVQIAASRASWLERLQGAISGYFEPVWETVRQPRFAMSFGMAFFALSVGLTVLGVKPHDFANISLRPSVIRKTASKTYFDTQARVVRYYENVRVVYELESRVREFKRNVTPAEPGPAKQKEHKNDTTQQPEQKQERNYSQTDKNLILAGAPLGPSVNDLPVVSVTTYRRFV